MLPPGFDAWSLDSPCKHGCPSCHASCSRCPSIPSALLFLSLPHTDSSLLSPRSSCFPPPCFPAPFCCGSAQSRCVSQLAYRASGCLHHHRVRCAERQLEVGATAWQHGESWQQRQVPGWVGSRSLGSRVVPQANAVPVFKLDIPRQLQAEYNLLSKALAWQQVLREGLPRLFHGRPSGG